MGKTFKNISIFLFLILLVYLATNFGAPLKDQVFEKLNIGSVKGSSTEKNKEVSKQVKTDLGGQLDNAKKQALNIRVVDVMNGFNRLKKIPQDISNVKNYTLEQFGFPQKK